MKEDINTIIQAVKGTDNPKLKAARLSLYLSNMLREKEINIYEAYLLNGEVINYEREGYILPAWNGWVSISTCLEFMNQRLLALAFKDHPSILMFTNFHRIFMTLAGNMIR